MKKIILILILITNILLSKDLCELYYTENYDKYNDINNKGAFTKTIIKVVYCDNPIIKKIKENKIYIEKKSNNIIINHENIAKTIYYRIYFKYIKKRNQKIYIKKRTKNNNNHICECIFKIKKSIPGYPYIFYKEKFICKNQNNGLKYEKNLGCRKRTIWKKNIKYEMKICPVWVNLIK